MYRNERSNKQTQNIHNYYEFITVVNPLKVYDCSLELFNNYGVYMTNILTRLYIFYE